MKTTPYLAHLPTPLWLTWSLTMWVTMGVTVSANLVACQPSQPPSASSATNSHNPSAQALSATASPVSTSNPTPNTAALPIHIDWQKMDSGVPAVEKHKFAYTFAPDSLPVQNYIKAYHVDTLTAQYNLTIGMGANEPLDKVLDQIGTSYVSHELTAGNDSKLVIHTTSKVAASEHNFVLTDPFAKGLILPVKIVPDGKK